VPATLVVARGPSVLVFAGHSPARAFALGPPLGPGDEAAVGRAPPAELLRALERVDPASPIVVCGAPLLQRLQAELHRPLRRATPEEWHTALAALPAPELKAERQQVLDRARADLEAALRSPEEILVSLAREEERLERSLGREERASETFIAVEGTVLAEYARAWAAARSALREHHEGLLRRLEAATRRAVPNLSAIVGARTAARLVAAGGGVAPLARMSASRLQLLGSRRRPSAERGPRYGAIYRADGLDDVPPERRAAFARSLAALAAIAVRADALTHADLAPRLVRRRDLRREQLRRRRS